MSINSFTYNGVSSETLGLYVGGQQTFGSPQRDVTKVSIPGRNGDLVRDNGRFLNAEIAYNVVAMSDFKNKAKSVRNWLMSAKGYKRLEDTYHPEHYRMARVADTVDFETGAFNATGKAKIIFDCMPQRFLKTGETPVSCDPVSYEESGDPATFNALGEFPFTKAEVSLSPIQSLNGYDHPWAGGANLNKLPPNATDGSTTTNGITCVAKDGVYKLSGTASAAASFTYTLSASVDLSPSTNKICFLNDAVFGTLSVYFRRGSTNVHFWGMSSLNRVASGWTDTGNEVIDTIQIYVPSGTAITGTMNISPMLVKLTETTPTTFSPWQNLCPITGHDSATLNIGTEYPTPDDSYPVTFPQTVYGCTFDWVSGKLKVTHGIVPDLGDLDWTQRPASPVVFYSALSGASMELTKVTTLSSALIAKANSSNWNTVVAYEDNSVCIKDSGSPYIAVVDSTSANATALKTKLSGVQLVYELATPIEIDLTPAQVQTLLGLNNVWADKGPVELEYSRPAYITNPTMFDAKPLIRVNGSGTCTVTVGNQIITLTDVSGYIDIDCETMNCYNGVVNCNSKVTLGAQGFPTLPPGDTWISFGGGTTSVVITPRWWEL